METKVILIDGIYTILTSNGFIADEIPRYLAEKVEQNFALWIISYNDDDNELWSSSIVPEWMLQNSYLLSVETFREKFLISKTTKIAKDSIIITDSPIRAKAYKTGLSIFSTKELFDLDNFNAVNFADVYLCYGFTFEKFSELCKNSSLIGMHPDRVINMRKNANGIAIYFDSSDAFKSDVNFGKLCLKNMSKLKKYEKKHKTELMVLVCGGENVSDMVKGEVLEKKIPLLNL